MSVQEFDAELVRDEDSGGVTVRVPFNVQEVYGTKAQLRVRGSIDGVEFRGAIAPYGGVHYLGVRKDMCQTIGKEAGETVHVIIEPDTEPRTLELPDDFAASLTQNAAAQSGFEGLSFTNRKEYVAWITGAKKPDTRADRIEKAITLLAKGKPLHP